ncbi:hypothetical protein N665_0718s0025 [Sinapis alba]|nr:hypothetical protein N665_0718s0025 [Sinapis alba]
MDRLPFHLLEEILFKLNPKSLATMHCVDKSINSHMSNDPYFKSNVVGWIPKRSDDSSRPSLSTSAMEVDDEKVGHDDKPNYSGLGLIMRVIGKISPYAQKLVVKKKETRVGKRFLMDVERNNKRRRVEK